MTQVTDVTTTPSATPTTTATSSVSETVIASETSNPVTQAEAGQETALADTNTNRDPASPSISYADREALFELQKQPLSQLEIDRMEQLARQAAIATMEKIRLDALIEDLQSANEAAQPDTADPFDAKNPTSAVQDSVDVRV